MVNEISPLYLVADIGGTHGRFALFDSQSRQRIRRMQVLVADYADIADAIQAMLGNEPVTAALFAVAAPIDNDIVQFTNSPWHFSREALQAQFGWLNLWLLNDFAAAAYGLIALPGEAHQPIGTPRKNGPAHTRAVLGPGTGFGVAGLLHGTLGWSVLAGEGGHARFAPASELEIDVLHILRRKFGYVQREDILSGRGLCNLYQALAEIYGRQATPVTDPSIVTAAAMEQPKSFSADVLNLFCSILGSTAADIALDLGARGGLYIAGGMVPCFAGFFAASPFRTTFEEHGDYQDYLQRIPTFLVTRDDLGLAGAEYLLQELLQREH